MVKYLNPKTFKCTKCGECCRPIVKVSTKDISRIEKSGAQDFIVQDPIGGKAKTLKQVNGICMFLKRKNEEFYCSIYDHRPKVCREYPFVKDNLKLTDCVPESSKRSTPLKDIMPEN